MKKQTSAASLPVSRKFYASITSRVSESLALIGRTDAVGTAMDCIDRYLTDGTVPADTADSAVALTFALLRAEIDKAVERSARARRRHAEKTPEKTFEKSSEKAPQTETAAAETAPDDEPRPFAPRNRRERRLYEQEVRRAARRLARRLTCA